MEMRKAGHKNVKLLLKVAQLGTDGARFEPRHSGPRALAFANYSTRILSTYKLQI